MRMARVCLLVLLLLSLMWVLPFWINTTLEYITDGMCVCVASCSPQQQQSHIDPTSSRHQYGICDTCQCSMLVWVYHQSISLTTVLCSSIPVFTEIYAICNCEMPAAWSGMHKRVASQPAARTWAINAKNVTDSGILLLQLQLSKYALRNRYSTACEDGIFQWLA